MKNILFYVTSLVSILCCRGNSFNLFGLDKNEHLTGIDYDDIGDSNSVLSPETTYFRKFLLGKFVLPPLGFSRLWARFIPLQGPKFMVTSVIPKLPQNSIASASTKYAGPAGSAVLSNDNVIAENRTQRDHNVIFATAMRSSTPLSTAQTTVTKLRQNILFHPATESKTRPHHGIVAIVERKRPVRREVRASTTNKVSKKAIPSATLNLSNYATLSQQPPAHEIFAETISIASSVHPSATFLAADNPFTERSNTNKNDDTHEHNNAFSVLFNPIDHCSKTAYFFYIAAFVSSTIILLFLVIGCTILGAMFFVVFELKFKPFRRSTNQHDDQQELLV